MRRFEQEVRITNKYELQKQSKNKNVRQGMKKNNSNLKRF